jgi:hypothetical protein
MSPTALYDVLLFEECYSRKEGNTDAKGLKARKNVAAQKGLKEIVSESTSVTKW